MIKKMGSAVNFEMFEQKAII